MYKKQAKPPVLHLGAYSPDYSKAWKKLKAFSKHWHTYYSNKKRWGKDPWREGIAFAHQQVLNQMEEARY